MKIDKYFLYILLFLSLIAVLFFFNLGQERLNKITYLKDKEFILEKRIKSQTSLRREKLKIDNIDNFNDSSYNSLRKRVNNGKTLVMFISQKQCLDCIVQEYKKLKKLPYSAQNNIIILFNYYCIRDLRVFLSYNKFDHPIYNSINPIFYELKNSKDPILFVLDSSLIPQHIFIPISFMPDLTDEYLEFLVTEIFERKQHDVNNIPSEVTMKK